MTKRLLIITSVDASAAGGTWDERETYVKDFCRKLKERMEDTEVSYTTYSDATYVVRKGQVSIFDERSGHDLKDYDFVHFKNWFFDAEEAALIALYLRRHGILFVNPEVDSDLAFGKMAQTVRLAYADLPVVDTYFTKQAHLLRIFESAKLPAGFNFPLVMKANKASKGEDNHLVNNPDEAKKILAQNPPEKEFVIQNYLPNDGDYRFLFFGSDNPPMVFLRKARAGSHLNNTSQGGSGELVDVKNFPPKILQAAKKAAITLKREISGVDILVDKRDNRPYILEVNATPALATGYGLDMKLERFSEFLKQAFEAQEEE